MPKTSKARAVGLNHIALEVGDIEEALAFYGRLFEFTLRGKSEHAAFIDLGEFEQAPVEGQSLLDVADLERDVVQSDSAGFAGLGHGGCLQMSLVENVVRTRLPANVDMRTT